jgi:hypothetical protein
MRGVLHNVKTSVVAMLNLLVLAPVQNSMSNVTLIRISINHKTQFPSFHFKSHKSLPRSPLSRNPAAPSPIPNLNLSFNLRRDAGTKSTRNPTAFRTT